MLIRAGFWVPLLICTYLALVPEPPENAVFRMSDVILHGTAFTYLTFALVLVLLGGNPIRSKGAIALISLGAMFGYGLFLEVAQSFIPERTAEMADLWVDTAGIATGLVLAGLLGRWVFDLVVSISARLAVLMR